MGQHRICLTGIPGSGKTTAATLLFTAFRLCASRVSVDIVFEKCRYWNYLGRPKPSLEDEYEIWGSQISDEARVLRQGVRYVITDSPTSLILYFMKRLGASPSTWNHFYRLTVEWEKHVPTTYFFLNYTGGPVLPYGRWHTDTTQAEAWEKDLKEYYATYFPWILLHETNLSELKQYHYPHLLEFLNIPAEEVQDRNWSQAI